MIKSEIKPKTDYAFREKRLPGTSLQRVRVIKHIRGNKWKAQWIEPNPGLVHYVESGQLLAPWKEHKALLRDEANEARLNEYNESHGYEGESPLALAIEQIFESMGDNLNFYHHGQLTGTPEALARIRVRAGIQGEWKSSAGYVDRKGVVHAPFDEALALAQRLCAKEPATVLVGVEAIESEWTREATSRGGEHILPLLNKYRPSWALIRQWAGYDAAVAAREAEIERLGRLVWDAVYALQKAGLDREAAKLRRAIEKR